MTGSYNLITGGAGFIGSALADRLVESDDNVVIIDNLSTGREKNIPQNTEFIHGDLTKSGVFNKLNEYDIDTVHHLAGQSSGEKSFEDPRGDLESHILGTFNLLRWCNMNEVHRLIYSSSMSVYGDPEYLPVDEMHPVDPKTFYASGKLGAEAYVKLFDKLGMDTTIFRLFSVYGPGQNLSDMKQGMVSIFLSFVLNEEKILVKGPLDRFRDFVYIDDVIDAWLQSTDNPKTFGETYNIARNKQIQVSELIDCILELIGKPDYPIEVTDGTPGDQFGIYGDSSKFEADTSWQSEVTLRNGLENMIESYEDESS